MLLPRGLKTWTTQLAIAFAAWSVLALVTGFQQVSVAQMLEDRRLPLWTALRPAVQTYWIYALLTPVVIEFARRVEFQRGKVWRFALIHSAGFLGFALAQAALRVLIFSVRNPRTGVIQPRSLMLVYRIFLVFFTDNIFIYFPLVGAAVCYGIYVRDRQRELSQSKLQAQLASAELQILKMQLHPHFLFNTLQAISTLVGKDPQTAKRMIALLGDLLRVAIDRTGEQEVPLKDELDLLERYVQIELVRFGDRLRVDFDLDERSLDAMVPGLLLQPLVENAIRHGARSLAGAAEVRVKSLVQGERLLLTIEDDGPGMPPPEQRSPAGLGLDNTRSRLGHLYGTEYRLELENREAGGFRVTVEIPLRASGQKR